MPKLSRRSRIAFVGAGIVGKSLALALSRQGYSVVAASSRSFPSAQELAHLVMGVTAYEAAEEAAGASDVVFITSPDDAIATVVSSISWRPEQAVVHCSGVSSLDVLEPALVLGAAVGTIHPMQAFSSVETGVQSIPGTTFGIEGEGGMRAYLEQMATSIGGRPIFLRPEDKALYHLSGVMMGGLLSTLAAVAAQLWEHLGLQRDDGVWALAPMMRQVSVNLETSGVPGGLQGPYIRGDVGTIKKHLQVLRARAPDVLPLYCHMAWAALPFAIEKGALSADTAEEIWDLINQYKDLGGTQAGGYYRGEH
jgi:predicted short-subunit dehydrogenase-like oxidoreductase (DUF2520 family)